MSLERKFELLLVRRPNKPMTNSNQVFRYEECKDFLRRFPVKALPWSRKFTTEQFDKGGPWLHYNYADAAPELPRDPANIFWMCDPLDQSFELWKNKAEEPADVPTQAQTQDQIQTLSSIVQENHPMGTDQDSSSLIVEHDSSDSEGSS